MGRRYPGAVPAMGCGMLATVRWVIVAAMVAGCGRFAFDADVPSPFTDAPIDVPPLAPFGTATLISASVPGDNDEDCTMPEDQLSLYFTSTRFGLPGEIYVVTRATLTTPWSPSLAVSALNSMEWEATPEISADDRTMWLTSTRLTISNSNDLFVATRTSRSEPWNTPVRVDELSMPNTYIYGPAPIPSQLAMVFSSTRDSGNLDLFLATRASVTDAWRTPQPFSELNTAAGEADPFLTGDGLTLYFQSDASGNDELVVATRRSTTEPFGAPVPLVELNSSANEQDLWMSADGHHVIFSSNRNGDKDLFEAFR
jgi:hypothetical protein